MCRKDILSFDFFAVMFCKEIRDSNCLVLGLVIPEATAGFGYIQFSVAA